MSDRPDHVDLSRAEPVAETLNARTLSRRGFLVVTGGGVLLAGVSAAAPGLTRPARADVSSTFSLDLKRPADMARLRFDFYNLVLSKATSPPQLVRQDDTKPAYVVVGLPSQHVMEQPVFDDGTPDFPGAGNIAAKAVQESRIAFVVPNTVKSLPYTEEGLFAWWQWVMQVHPRAVPPGQTSDDDRFRTKPMAADDDDVTNPAQIETDLLLVDWLHLSPDKLSTWSHPAKPLTYNGRTELWHTRLKVRADNGRPDEVGPSPTVRAVFADQPTADDAPFTVLNPDQGENCPPGSDTVPNQIVKLTTDFGLEEDFPGLVTPATTDLLLLSPMGSSLDLHAAWKPAAAADVNLAKWLHRSAIGRDNYVRIERYGFCFPFGHRSVLITETERKIADDGTAYLIQKEFVFFRERILTYPGYADEVQGRRFPFKTIRINATTSPNLPPSGEREEISDGDEDGCGAESFWIQQVLPDGTTKADVPFPIIATDWAGNTIEFTCTLAFIFNNDAIVAAPPPWASPDPNSPALTELIATYAQYDTLEDTPDADITKRRTVQLNGQSVAFAPPDQPGDTTYPVKTLYLGAYGSTAPVGNDLSAEDRPNFYPSMLGADIRLAAVEALQAGALSGGGKTIIGYDKGYVDAAFTKVAADGADMFVRVQNNLKNMGQLLHHLEVPAVGAPTGGELTTSMTNAAKNVGAVAIPQLDIGALSRRLGPLSGAVDNITGLAAGTFEPRDFFRALGANLLGDIKLSDILLKDVAGAPSIVTKLEYENGPENPPSAVVTHVLWEPKLGEEKRQPDPDDPNNLVIGPFFPKGVGGKDATFTLRGEFRTVLSTGASTSKVTGELRDFTLKLVDPDVLHFINVVFNKFVFEQHDDAKPSFDPEIAEVVFDGPLKFINTLQKYLSPLAGLASNSEPGALATVSPTAGPSIDVQPNGVTFGYTLAIPTVSVGVFSLQNMSFSAGITLPFDGSAILGRFGFCSPENRFVVSVWVFGGGGFFELDVDTSGIRRLEAAIEFGGVLALDIFIASGSLSVMAGIYFKLERKTDSLGNENNSVTISAYLRAVGRLSVLGLITISAEFYLELKYYDDDEQNYLEGVAILKVKVEVLVFSKTVELEVRKRFNGPASSSQAALAATPQATGRTFGDLMTQADWTTYCDSFAA